MCASNTGGSKSAVPANKPAAVQGHGDQSAVPKQNKPQQSYNAGGARYAPQRADQQQQQQQQQEHAQYHQPRVEDSSAAIPACLNRPSSTLIYSSDGGDLGE